MRKPRIPLIYGGSAIGAAGTFSSLTDAKKAQKVVDALHEGVPIDRMPLVIRLHEEEQGEDQAALESVPVEAIDTSNVSLYTQILGEMDLYECAVDTKSGLPPYLFYPLAPGDHSRAKLREAYDRMLESLGEKRVRVLYLNAPDHATPFEETLAAMDELYQEGKFEMLGLSNYRTHEVAHIVTLCRGHGWVAPSVYQGVYNAVDRSVESELIPCLRQFNIKFAAYCPLAGGYLTGNLLFEPELADGGVHLDLAPIPGPNTAPRPRLRQLHAKLRGSRRKFDPQNPFGKWYLTRYLHPKMNDAVLALCVVLDAHGISLHAASIRWLQHHSALLPTDLGIVFGGRTPAQVTQTLMYSVQGALPEAVVTAFEECYEQVKGSLPGFWIDPAQDHGVAASS
ncbi:Aflatoxin B1-aldehyde reductase [Mycena chlorophos]|uniref:Aflatoxin B1-aldehyde reductase n=1 Tax=Mycena chlorophos TaxID=658473 RepID=A0A8H6SKR2_MYCCL|nr:Aflatoxin B1-aldehyde reductase [Mycena chlorophos]